VFGRERAGGEMFNYNVKLNLTRVETDGSESHREIMAIVMGDKIALPITANIDVDDLLEQTVPSGQVKRMRVVKVDHAQSPFGTSELDHIEVETEPVGARSRAATRRIDLPGLHPDVSTAAGALFEDGHLGSAIFEAFKAVENRVQSLAGRQESGVPLMTKVFGKPPLLDVTTSSGRSADDERDGFRFLFMGAMAAIRNPRGHGGSSTADTPQEALEMLALASVLMRRLDTAAARLKPLHIK
jgi:uncharacterized protein (TIGR02391 family)